MFDSNPVSGYRKVQDEKGSKATMKVIPGQAPWCPIEVVNEPYNIGSKAPPAMAMISRADPVFV